jgi:hypothetical protein
MRQRTGNDGRWVGGVVLIIIGLALLVGQWVPDVGHYAPLAVGLALLALFLVTRNPGALIGGSIVTGIGAGVALDAAYPGTGGGWVPLGLGFGFLGIWLIGALFRMPEARFWPLIPGGILVFAGLAVLGPGAADVSRYAWPIALIVLGVAVLARGLRRPPVPPPVAAAPAPSPPPDVPQADA